MTTATKFKARKLAVHRPDDPRALILTAWPPESRAEVDEARRCLSRVRTLDPAIPLLRYFGDRLSELDDYVRARSERYRGERWSVSAPNGATVLFPLSDASTHAFKALVEECDGNYEPVMVDFLLRRLGPGDLFVDVGAHVGYVSALAASTGAAVFAMELQRDLIAVLDELAVANGFDLLRPIHAAASSRSGLVRIARRPAHVGARVNQGTAEAPNVRSVIADYAPTLALDDAFANDELLPSLIKVDVEGHEIDVVQGCRRIIEAGRTSFVIEYHPHILAQANLDGDQLLRCFDPDRWSRGQLTAAGVVPVAAVADIVPDELDPNPKLVFEPLVPAADR